MTLKLPGEEEEESLFPHNNDYDEGIRRRGIRTGASTIVLALDGSGDAETLKEALKLVKNGGLIFVKEGTFKLTELNTISKNDISIEGIGRASIFDVETETGIKITGDYATFKNMRFKCDEERVYGIEIDGSIGSSVKDCWIDGEFLSGIFVTGTNSKTIITGNIIDNALGPSINILGVTDLIISNNIIDNAIDIASSSRVIMDSNIVRNQNDGIGGINLTTINDSIISNNYVEDDSTGDGGITLFANCDNNVITGNRIRDFANGIYIKFATCNKNLVGHNIVLNNTTPINDNGTNTTLSNNITA